MATGLLRHDITQAANGTAVVRGLIKENTEGRRCKEHGDLLTVHGSGSGMVCLRYLGIKKGEAQFCPYGEPISVS